MNLAREVQTYQRHRGLRLAAAEIGISRATLCRRLKSAGVPADSHSGRLGALGEAEFRRLVPDAVSYNDSQYLPPIDFNVRGYEVDVKSAIPRRSGRSSMRRRSAAHSDANRWSFKLKSYQATHCDFICCFCMTEGGAIDRVLLVPYEAFAGQEFLSVSCGGSKWFAYAVPPQQLAAFFASLPEGSP